MSKPGRSSRKRRPTTPPPTSPTSSKRQRPQSKREQILAGPPSLPSTPRFFIARSNTSEPPAIFQFARKAPWIAKKANADWIDTGVIDEQAYLAEIEGKTATITGKDAVKEEWAASASDTDSASGVEFTYVPMKPRTACEGRNIAIPTASSSASHATAATAPSFTPPTFDSGSKGWSAQQNKALWHAQLKHGECKNWAAVREAVNAAGPSKSQNECRLKWGRERVKVFGKI